MNPVDLGVLLSVPLESVAIRAVVATLLAAAAVRMLLRSGLRTPQARFAAAVAPLLALAAVVILSGTHLRPPTLMLPEDGARALSIPVQDGYLQFVPIAVPVIAGTWALVAGLRLLRRVGSGSRVRREAVAAIAATQAPPARLDRIARSVAAALDVPPPTVGVVDGCRGGAYVVGTRSPQLVVDRQLLDGLDDEELEGVLAHELAHVRRRDTLVATVLGVVRDLMFFVPGGGWAVRQLHRERELAADQLAVCITGRPGALASGLLKVLDGAPGGAIPSAALAPTGSVVDRVRVLVDHHDAPSAVRRGSETTAIVLIVLAAVVGALVVPNVIVGSDKQREALALVWSASPANPAVAAPGGEARAFDVYRRTALEVARPTLRFAGQSQEPSQENRRAALHACADPASPCPVPDTSPTLGLRPPTITFDEEAIGRWEATPIANFESPDGFRVFWLANNAR
ncbi:MAG: M48 family metalloprotease [Nitriliruptoraceae bacterium]